MRPRDRPSPPAWAALREKGARVLQRARVCALVCSMFFISLSHLHVYLSLHPSTIYLSIIYQFIYHLYLSFSVNHLPSTIHLYSM